MPAIRSRALKIAVLASLVGALLGLHATAAPRAGSRAQIPSPDYCRSHTCESMIWLRLPAMRRSGR